MNTSVDGLHKKRLGDFEVIRELGRGGMGIVYEARQRSLNRKVALKVLSSGLGMTTKAVVRFRREAETAAKLHHTNIVPIHATGEEDGTHYYAMELVDGPSLNFVIRDMREQSRRVEPNIHLPTMHGGGSDSTIAVPPQPTAPGDSLENTGTALPEWVAQTMTMEVGGKSIKSGASAGESSSSIAAGHTLFDNIARMIADVADALDYAHSHGVVHRDMKPSNLLLSPDGRLSINDFGLARMLEQPGMTTTGEFMGSPLYMSPEQIAAGRAPLDHRTDIYSLGATLYELLTLQPPFPGERRDQIIGQIMHKEPRSPRSVNRKIPVDLDTICLKAMEKDPDRRYQTGGAMAEDLRRFVNRFAISAKRAGLVGRATKWVRRHPAVAASLAIALMAGMAAGGFAYSSHLTQLRLRTVELENAKETALLNAMSGDFGTAESNIQKAEALGATAGWVRLLRGQVAYYQGRFADALTHVEQAMRLMPDSVATMGLMCVTLSELGDADKLYAMHERLTKMEPKGFQDLLLKGLGETWLSPRRAIRDLDAAIALRPFSPVARLLRADALRLMAMNTGELRYAELSVEDAVSARGFLPENPMTLSALLLAQLVRSNLFSDAGLTADSESTLREARNTATELERYSENQNAMWARAYYFMTIGDDDQAHATLCEGILNQAEDRSWMAACCANGWFNRRESAKALEAFERAEDSDTQLLWTIPVFLRMEQASDLGVLANEHIANRKARDNSSRFFEVLDWAAFRLIGDTARANETAERWSDYRVPGDFGEQWQSLAGYMTGELSADEVVSACEGARFAQSYAHYIIAVDSLANGDRASAKRHFRSSIDLKFFNLFSSFWSKSFLARLEQDPTWPPWIPVLGREETKTEVGEPTASGGRE